MLEPIVYRIRVADDEHHSIYIDDFDSFENDLVDRLLDNVGSYLPFYIGFFPVSDSDEDDLDG